MFHSDLHLPGGFDFGTRMAKAMLLFLTLLLVITTQEERRSPTMKGVLRRLSAVAAALLVSAASAVFAGTIIDLPAEYYSIEVSSLLQPSPTVTVSSDGRAIDVQNAFSARGGSVPVTYSDTFTFRILPDAGRQLVKNEGWTAVNGGGYVGGATSYLYVTGATSALSGGAESQFTEESYTHNWFNSYSFSYDSTWHDRITPFSEGFVLKWSFRFASNGGGNAGIGGIHVCATTMPASTVPDQTATLILLGLSLFGLAQARRLAGC